MSDLVALAERIERSRSRFSISMEDQAAFLSFFGLTQRHYERAGWKMLDPSSNRPLSALRPIGSLDDLRTITHYTGIELPAMIPSDPLKAAAFVLRAKAKPPVCSDIVLGERS